MGCSNSKVVEENSNENSKESNKNESNNMKIDTNPNNSEQTSSLTNKLKLKGILNNDELANHYKVIEKIGTGSFGKVYKVLHLKTGQERALKVINKAIIKLQDDEKQFLKEIELLSQLDHPSIIKVFEYFMENNNYYVVQELCKGGELYEQIYQIDCFTENSAAEIMKQLFSAVYYLHSMNIVHRDLKPENIMIENVNVSNSESFNIKLIDFGTANYYNPKKLMNQKIGTSYYIAPEVIQKKYNQKCDIWSCGIILFILLSGYPPFDGDTDDEIMEAVVRDNVSFEEPEWQNVSKEALAFVKKLLNKDYNKRISAEEALKDNWIVNSTSKHSKVNYNLSSQIQNFQKFDSKMKLKNAILAFMVHQLATEEMTRELRESFKKLDKSGDGRLSLEELREGFKEILKTQNRENLITDEEITRRFNAIDIDKSNYIEIEEFITVTINEELLMNEKNLRMTFDYFDKDKSGQLDSSEIENLLNYKGGEEDKNIVKELIVRYDTNGDGVLSFDEFKNLIIEFNPNLKQNLTKK